MKTKELNKGEIIITSQDLHKPIYEFFKKQGGNRSDLHYPLPGHLICSYPAV